MVKRKRVVGVIVRNDGLCQKTDDEIIRSALFSKVGQLERTLERKKHILSPNEHKALQDEYERTFALTEQFHHVNGHRANAMAIDDSFPCPFPDCESRKKG